jgi:hypothetical protein
MFIIPKGACELVLLSFGKNLGSWKIAAMNPLLCSPATALENSLDDTKQVCQFIGTPSEE